MLVAGREETKRGRSGEVKGSKIDLDSCFINTCMYKIYNNCGTENVEANRGNETWLWPDVNRSNNHGYEKQNETS